MLLLVDNYDSFTYNLFQYLSELGAEVVVRRNDAIGVEEVGRMGFQGVVISPGPGRPEDAGVSMEIIRRYTGHIPILGVCLGHQCIGQAFGGRIVRAPELRHGKTSWVHHKGAGVLSGIPSPFEAVRYHSLIVDRSTVPPELEVTAETEDGLVMALRHRRYPVEGVQFHPESILTQHGKRLLANFLRSACIPVSIPDGEEGHSTRSSGNAVASGGGEHGNT